MKKELPLIIQIAPYFPPHKGGVEEVAYHMTRQLAEQGHPVRVIASDLGGGKAGNERTKNYEVRRLSSIEIAHTPIMWRLIPELLKMPRGSVVHMHISQAFVPEVAYAIARLKGARFVAHYHLDVTKSGALGFLLQPYQKLFLRQVMRRADKVIVPTADYGDVAQKLYNLDTANIIVIPNATTHSLRTTPRKAPHRTAKLMSVGRFSVQKNHPLLLRALKTFRDTYPTIPFTMDIFGVGELKLQLQKLIKDLELQDVVSLKNGNIPSKKMETAYAAHDLFMLATSKESFGLVYAEAMTKALPIVTTNVPGVRNVVLPNRNGLLKSQTPKALADGLHALLTNNPRYSKISKQNLEDAQQYTWPRVTKQVLAVYEELQP